MIKRLKCGIVGLSYLSLKTMREYDYISEYFNDEWGEIYILKPPSELVVKDSDAKQKNK